MRKSSFIDCTDLINTNYINAEKIIMLIGLSALQIVNPNIQMIYSNNGKMYEVQKKMIADFYMLGIVGDIHKYATFKPLNINSDDIILLGTTVKFNEWCTNPYTNERFFLVSELNVNDSGLYEKNSNGSLNHMLINVPAVLNEFDNSSFIDATVERIVNEASYNLYLIDTMDTNLTLNSALLNHREELKKNIIVLFEGEDVTPIYDYLSENINNVVFYRKANLQTIIKLIKNAEKRFYSGRFCSFYDKALDIYQLYSEE